jgi:flagellar biosynthesis anti-sigma factor FlgM
MLPWPFRKSLGHKGLGRCGPPQPKIKGEKVGLFPDEVRFSVDREKVQQLEADLDGLPDPRQERVAVLRQAIEAGSYKVPIQQIAQAMSSDLLGQRVTGTMKARRPRPWMSRQPLPFLSPLAPETRDNSGHMRPRTAWRKGSEPRTVK